MISLLPLAVLVGVLEHLTPAGAIVALGSTSRFSKMESQDPKERAAAGALAEAEAALGTWARSNAIPFTILRPTLVYDMERDRNLARMAGFIRRFRCLPLASPAGGLRQPIHADDVAKAILAAVGNPRAANAVYNIAGGERLTYRAMAERVFQSLGLQPRLIMLPTGLLRLLFRLAGRLGLLRDQHFGSSIFQRMNQDLVFEVEDGLRALAYDPRPFHPGSPPRSGDLDCRSVARA